MKSAQLPPGDAEDSRKHLKRLLSKTLPLIQVAKVSHSEGSPRLKFMALKGYGTETHALLDNRAVPNKFSWEFCEKLTLSLMAADLQATIFDGTAPQIIG